MSQSQRRKPLPGLEMPPDESPQFFPPGIFHDRSDLDEFKAEWYASDLRAMSEPSLLEASKDKTLVAYRFLWLRTFHHPIAVRLTIQTTGIGSLNAKSMTGTGGFGPGTISQNKSVQVSTRQVQRFSELLRKAAFWSLQTEGDVGGLDGASWILEGVQNGVYHIVDRWSPTVDRSSPGNGDYAKVCLYLLDLSRIYVDPKEVY